MDSFTKILMISIAIVFDGIEFVLGLIGIGIILNRILTLIEYLIFFTWFWFIGVKFTGKATTAMGRTFIAEMIPVVGSLPGLTLGVYLVIKSHEARLKEGNETGKKKKPRRSPNLTRSKKISNASGRR